MGSIVKHWADQIVHRGVDNYKRLSPIFLHIEDAGEQHSSGTDDGATRLDEQAAAKRTNDLRKRARKFRRDNRRFACIADAEASANVDKIQAHAIFCEIANVGSEPRKRLAVRGDVEN